MGKRLFCNLVGAVLRKRIDEFLNKSSCYLVKPDMSDCRINSLCELSLACVGRAFEVEFCIFFKPFLSEGFKLYCRYDLPPLALLLKENCLSLYLLFDLLCGHFLVGRPSHSLKNLCSVRLVAAGYLNSIRVAPFFD